MRQTEPSPLSHLELHIVWLYLKGKDSGWGTDDGYCIVENAETYSEAIEVLKKYHLIPKDF